MSSTGSLCAQKLLIQLCRLTPWKGKGLIARDIRDLSGRVSALCVGEGLAACALLRGENLEKGRNAQRARAEKHPVASSRSRTQCMSWNPGRQRNPDVLQLGIGQLQLLPASASSSSLGNWKLRSCRSILPSKRQRSSLWSL